MSNTLDSNKNLWSYHAGWLDSPLFDSIFIFGLTAIAILSGAIVFIWPELFYPVLTLDVILLGYHHVIATYTKLVGTKEDRKEYFFLIYILPIIVIAAVVALYFFIGSWIIVSIYFFWQWYHYTRQSYGIGVFYQRKSKKASDNKKSLLSHLVIWSIPVWGVLHRCNQGWETFIYSEIYLPHVPDIAVTCAMVIAIISLFWWVYSKVLAYKNGNLSIAQTAYTTSHILIFSVGYIIINDITVGWLVANIWHNAQYIMFVWLYNVNRSSKIKNDNKKSILDSLLIRKPKEILYYFFFTFSISFIFYTGLHQGFDFIAGTTGILISNLYIIGFQTVNFHHYVVDSFIWKAKNKKNQEILNVK